MQDQFKFKKWIFFAVLFATLAVLATPVLADYLGPDREVTTTTTTCSVVLYECRYVEAKNEYRYRRAEDWSCSNESKPWLGYPSDGQGCSDNTVGDQYWSHKETLKETTIVHPPATITGSLQNCTVQNGWCGVTVPEVFLSANEPIAGYKILLIEGTRNGEVFACPSGAASCNVPLPQGDNSFAYWALSSWGDSSEMGMLNVKVDTVSPDLSLDISGSSGTNGWYVSPTTVTAVGSDATSGLASVQLSVNGGAWQPSVTLNEGVYDVAAAASDNAGNVSNASTVISVDTTTPSINITINGTTGLNGWYLSSIEVSAFANDATSGVGTFEVSADGGAYQSYTSPVFFSDGHHTIRFKAVDFAGNITETPVQEFYVDTIPPTVHLPGSWQIGRNVPYDVQDDGSGLASLRLVIEDEDERYAKVAWDERVSGWIYSKDINWNGEFRDKTIAPPGTYLVWIKAADKAGNERIKLGKVIIPEPNIFFNVLPQENSLTEVPDPPEDLYAEEPLSPDVTSPSLSSNFGGSIAEITEPATQSLFLTSGTSATIPSTSSNVLWGAAAAAVIGSATAYALTERNKRKEAETEQAVQVAKQLDRDSRKRAGKKRKQQENWDRQQALEQARLQEERERQLLSNARMDTKMARLDAEDEARWTASQVVIQKREEENKKVEKQYTGLTSYRNSEWHSEPAVAASPKEKPWWEKGLDWVDNHQTEIALGIGIVAGVGAIILTGGMATPLVAAALVAGSAVAAGTSAGLMTIGLNVHYGRDWNENLLKNLAVAGVAAAAVSTIGFVFHAAATGISSYCGLHPSTCARVEPVLNAIDKVEETWLRVKLAFQIWSKDEIGAAETRLEVQTEYADGDMPGNAVAKELGDQLAHLSKNAAPVIRKYGNDVVPLLIKYGDEGLALIQRFGTDGIDLLRKHGNDATDLIVLDDDVLEYVMQQGDEAVAALSRWSKDELQAHGPELALRAKKDAAVLADIKKLTLSGPIDPKSLTEKQRALIEAIAANSTQYADGGQVVLGKWVDLNNGFVQTAQDTGSLHYNPHPDMWTMLGRLGNAKQEEVAWLINKQVVKNGIDNGLPFEYTLNGVPSKKILDEANAVEAIFAGASDAEIMDILQVKTMPIRMKELKELHSAKYRYTFDETTNSYILISP